MSTIATTFKYVEVGEVFYWGGNKCKKRSTRTADLLGTPIEKDERYVVLMQDVIPDAFYSSLTYPHWFYFKQDDCVTVG
jgi:hypothetical protein